MTVAPGRRSKPDASKELGSPEECAEGGCRMDELFRLLGKTYVMDLLYVFHSDTGPKRFVDLQNRLGMSPNTLSDRLRELVDHGLLTRTAFNEIPPRVEYQVTEKAKALKEVFRDLWRWSRTYDLKPITVEARTN